MLIYLMIILNLLRESLLMARLIISALAMMSDPERVFRQVKPAKRVRSAVSKESQQPVASRSKPSQEVRPEPELPPHPPLPPMNMTLEDNNIILNSEASFQELNPDRPSEGDYHQLLSRFTNHNSSQGRLVPVQEARASVESEAEASAYEHGSAAMSESDWVSEPDPEPKESTPRPTRPSKQASQITRTFL
jgi:hypothetical protein